MDTDNPSFFSPGAVLTGGADPLPGSLANPLVTVYAYDALGNLLLVDQKGPAPSDSTQWRTRTFAYDSLNRVTGKAYSAAGLQQRLLPSGTAVVSYAYDQGTNGIGRLTSLTDQAGSGSYSYGSKV